MATFIISEFDPFHKGHKYLIDEAKRRYPEDEVVCITSGNFVQRATPAVLDKYSRARAAVREGADLVLLLPAPYSFSSASYFARAGVHIASSLGIGGRLFFGSESGSIAELEAAARLIFSEEFQSRLNSRDKDLPYAPYRRRLFEEYGFDGVFLDTPNNILALEYISAILSLSPKLGFDTVKRSPDFRSASELRAASAPSEVEPYVPAASFDEIRRAFAEGKYPADIRNAERAVISAIRAYDVTEPLDGEGGLYQRIRDAASRAASYDELVTLSSTKIYTTARVRRVILNAYLSVKKSDAASLPRFTSLLAASGRGCELLKKLRKTSSIPILTKPSKTDSLDSDALKAYGIEARADELYALCTPVMQPSNAFMKATPYIEK